MHRLLLTTLVLSSLLVGKLAHGNEPSALELRQMQTRIFQTTPAKLHRAVIEYCQNRGGMIAIIPWNMSPEHDCLGIQRTIKYTLAQEGTGATLVRVRLSTLGAPSWDPSHYESIFKAIGDMLVLNEVGVEIKVFK